MTVADRNPNAEPAGLFGPPEEWRAALVALRRHPLFPHAMRCFLNGYQTLLANHPEARGILNDRGKCQSTVLALALHGTLDSLDPRSGLTGERLRQRCTALHLCSRGRVLTIIDGLKQAGYLVMAPASGDGRVRRMQPTPLMMRVQAERVRANAAAATLLLPQAAPLLAALDNDVGIIAMAAVQTEALALGQRQLALSPILESVADTTSAVVILTEQVAAGLSPATDAALPGAFEVPLSISALSRRHGVSRKHVLKVLTLCEAAGLVARPVAGGDRLLVRDALIEEVANHAAGMMQMTVSVATVAMERLRRRAAPI